MPLTARLAPPPLWRSELERYFTSVPQYYCAPLKALLLSISLPGISPVLSTICCGYTVGLHARLQQSGRV